MCRVIFLVDSHIFLMISSFILLFDFSCCISLWFVVFIFSYVSFHVSLLVSRFKGFFDFSFYLYDFSFYISHWLLVSYLCLIIVLYLSCDFSLYSSNLVSRFMLLLWLLVCIYIWFLVLCFYVISRFYIYLIDSSFYIYMWFIVYVYLISSRFMFIFGFYVLHFSYKFSCYSYLMISSVICLFDVSFYVSLAVLVL